MQRLALRPLRNEAEYDAAVAVLDQLVVRKLSSGERDYLAALTRFVEDFDQRKRTPPGEGLGPLKILKHLMSENDMSTAELGRMLGSSSAASMILRGRRALSKAQIRKLAARFHVDPGVFF